MKIILVSFSDCRGGAAKAALRQLQAMERNFSDCDFKYIVAEKNTEIDNVYGPSFLEYIFHFILRCISFSLSFLQRTRNVSKKSINIFSSPSVVKYLKRHDSDVLHFHWMNNDTLSIKQLEFFIKRFNGTIIITLHDDWFFCGSEHYALISERYLNGYSAINKSVDVLYGIDIDRWVFTRKNRMRPFFGKVIFTSPSIWHAKRAASSFLLRDADVRYIPNVIDVDTFSMNNRERAREKFGLNKERFLIGFGAVGGIINPVKGFDLMLDVIKKMSSLELVNSLDIFNEISFAIFGGGEKSNKDIYGFHTHNVGVINSPKDMADFYSACDLIVIPSRMESFGQVAAESLSCETPVVCFDNSGVAEIVSEGGGAIVPAFDTDQMCSKIIEFFLMSDTDRKNIGKNGRNSIVRRYSSKIVSSQWHKLYSKNKD